MCLEMYKKYQYHLFYLQITTFVNYLQLLFFVIDRLLATSKMMNHSLLIVQDVIELKICWTHWILIRSVLHLIFSNNIYQITCMKQNSALHTIAKRLIITSLTGKEQDTF